MVRDFREMLGLVLRPVVEVCLSRRFGALLTTQLRFGPNSYLTLGAIELLIEGFFFLLVGLLSFHPLVVEVKDVVLYLTDSIGSETFA